MSGGMLRRRHVLPQVREVAAMGVVGVCVLSWSSSESSTASRRVMHQKAAVFHLCPLAIGL